MKWICTGLVAVMGCSQAPTTPASDAPGSGGATSDPTVGGGGNGGFGGGDGGDEGVGGDAGGRTASGGGGEPATTTLQGPWWKGQLHAHAVNHDNPNHAQLLGDSDWAAKYLQAYDEQTDYDFVGLSDHGVVTAITYDKPGEFIALPSFEGTNELYHYNCVAPANAPAAVNLHQEAVDACYAAGGALVQFNHPVAPAISGADLIGLQNLQSPALVEVIYWSESVAVWDAVLSAGVQIFGTGTSDQHGFAGFDSEGTLHGSPDRAYVMVAAPRLTQNAIEQALVKGAFYASDGGRIDRIETGEDEFTVESADATSIEFYGPGLELLASSNDVTATYTVTDELFVRAEVQTAAGRAYTQAYFPE